MADSIVASYDVTPAEFQDKLIEFVKMREPVMAWGPTGVGKSDSAMAVAKELGYEYIDVRALLFDPVDLHGLPYRDANNKMRWAEPGFLPDRKSKGKFLINLEELPAAPGPVQTALYQLVLDRKMGEYELPEGAAVMACGNRQSDGGTFHKMSPALATRFICHYDVKPDIKAWTIWAGNHGIAPEVVFFLQWQDHLLHNYDRQSQEHAFPTPRGWEKVSRFFEQHRSQDLENDRSTYRGMVGAGAAVEFTAFLRIWRELPHPRTIFNDPENAPIPKQASTLLALCGSMCRMVDDITIEAMCKFSQRLTPEIGEFMVGQAIKRHPDLQHTIAYTTWAALSA